ncbi:MAG TPA: phosphate ABC transporter permease PstA [Kiritimatiellia bacterium]|nr:phosphate ABC transporter permease PstA [Kiritimatiellia bacterium]HQQ04798.1 phosphate ABC transporter permease PstA [Kiritimatiellia bacterium]
MKRSNLAARKIEEGIFKGLMYFSVAIVLGTLLLITGIIIAKGLPSLSIQMLTQTPKGGYYLGKEGGILNAIIGSIYLATGATLLALIISLPVSLYINVYTRSNSKLAALVRFSMDILWGIPSIVYGAFGFIIMISLGLRASLGAAIIAVSLFELPIMVRAMDEVLKMIPPELAEASYSLGATRTETAFRVIVRQAIPGLITGVLMAFGRGIGDTASVLFTAGFTDRIPTSLSQPAATLPLAIFFQLGTPFPEVQGRAYAAATVLTIMVLIISLTARLIAHRYSKCITR